MQDCHEAWEKCAGGELAAHADLALAEIIFGAGMFADNVLRVLRVTYWEQWYERTGMWVSETERSYFGAMRKVLHGMCGVSAELIEAARAVATRDAERDLETARAAQK